jgi:hypothetical protein
VDVRLPNGTVIQNIPDGTTKAQLIEKLVANGYDISQLGLAPAPTTGDRANAALGGVNRGIAGLGGLAVDTVENALNLGIAGVGGLATALGRADLAPQPLRGSLGGSEWLAQRMQRGGINTQNPRPDDPASRALYTGGVIAGGSMIPGVRPGPVAGAAAGGAVASEALGPEWAGVMTPAAATQSAAAAKNAVANRVQQNVQNFKAAGSTPSVGQATESNFLQALESLLSKFPGGQGVFRSFSEYQQRRMGERTATGTSAEDAGRAIERGTKSFIATSKAEWKRLDDAMAAKIPATARFRPASTVSALDELTAVTPGAEKTTGALVNPKVAEIKANIAADLQANNGQIPFEALRALRSRVGSMLDDSLVSGIPNGELKKLYGALSEDLKAAANAAGAGKEFARQNNFYAARMDRIEETLERVVGTGKHPEDIFRAFMPTDANQANKIRGVMRSLEPADREIVTQAVVDRLGRATPGKQSDTGDVFSSERFLTNWNRLSSGAKAQLFPDEAMRKSLDKIAAASANIRRGSSVFVNPSGSAGAGAAYGVGAGAVAAAVGTGSAAPLVGAAVLIGGANVTSRLLTNPAFVDWLAKASTTKSKSPTLGLAQLGVIYNSISDEETKRDLTAFTESLARR